jgi:hypothetical protein
MMNVRQHEASQLDVIKSVMDDAWSEPIIDDLFNIGLADMTTDQLFKLVEKEVLDFQNDYNEWSNGNV